MFADPTFWVAISFIVFIALMVKPAKKVLGTLDKRAGRIKEQIEEAEKLREDAQHLLAEYQRKQRQAIEEAGQILAHARAEATRHREQTAQALDTALKRRERQALDRIAQAEAQAVDEVRQAAADIAVAATRRLLESSLDDAKRAEMIESAIKELPQKIH